MSIGDKAREELRTELTEVVRRNRLNSNGEIAEAVIRALRTMRAVVLNALDGEQQTAWENGSAEWWVPASDENAAEAPPAWSLTAREMTD